MTIDDDVEIVNIQPKNCLYEHQPSDKRHWGKDLSVMAQITMNQKNKQIQLTIDLCSSGWAKFHVSHLNLLVKTSIKLH